MAVAAAEAEPGYGRGGYGGYGRGGRYYGKREAEADVIVAGPSGTITTGYTAPGHALTTPFSYGLGYATGLPTTYSSLAYAAPYAHGAIFGKRSADAEPGYGRGGYGGYGRGGRYYGKREAEPGYGRSGYGGYGRGGRYYG